MSRDLAHDASRPPQRAGRVAPVRTGAASPVPRSPAGLLGLQRLAGNRAVSALVAPPEPTVQRLVTMTGLKSEHAKKVLYNHLKGDPPFKPQRGNFGQVSWFAGSGNPYVGGQAQSYDVTINVVINPDPVRLPAVYFANFMRQYVMQTGANLKEQATHHDFWVALGRSLEGGGAQEVPIDQSDVSKQGGGTFVVVGGAARESISLANPDKLAQDLGGGETLKKIVETRRTNRQPTFTVVFDGVAPDQARTDGPRKALVPLVAQPAGFTKAEKNFPGMGWGDKKVGPTVQVTLRLTYADYTVARLQAKRLATAIGDGALAGHRVSLVGGTAWSTKATQSYRR